MRLLTIRQVVKRHGYKYSGWVLPSIEEQLEQADTFEEEQQFVFKEDTQGLTWIKGRYINWDWYYIDDNY